ncbi:MAG TPA: AarF/ABC1/UbiB kinase family protein, partial [Pseudomonadales bacterium]|nr:AarF/ABC1/UbiB kinase family protein [Pseudomonadales bacterium]
MLEKLRTGYHAARRIGQTGIVLQKSGWRWLHNRDMPLPELARDTVEALGSTYIKLGQLIASSPSLFPHEYVQAFQSCLDQTTPLPFSTIEKVLVGEFGPTLSRYFREIDPTPLASASIAQVHAARLFSGEDVVLKVQKPGVENILTTDFQFMQFSAMLLEKISKHIPDSSITDMVEEIRNGMLEECDFHREAENIATYRKFLDANNITHVTVPKVYRTTSTKRVLTMERFYGVPLSNTDEVRKRSTNPEQALIDGLNTWFLSLTQCQIYHADLHAGNVMMLDDGRIGFIDFGIVGRISSGTWESLLSLIATVPTRDFNAIAKALAGIGATNQAVDTQALSRDLQQLYLQFEEESNSDDFLNEVTMQVSALGRRHGIRFPREFTLLLKQFLYFDRYI